MGNWIMKIRDIVTEENKKGKITKRQQQPTRGLNKFTDGDHWNSDYTLYRLGLAVAATDGKTVPDTDKESWVGKWKVTAPYSQLDQDMLKQAYKAVGADYEDVNQGDMRSQELKSTNKASPVAKKKTNKYGV
jgi:hypothetical protein